MLRQRLLALIWSFGVLATPGVRAADLNEAFNSLLGGYATSVNSPGQYSSQARQSFIAGGIDVRFPRSNANLISVSPPMFNAGCTGITAHFGGFNFISSAEMENLIKQIANGSIGFAVGMAIKAICPQCSSVIETMQALAQKASQMNIDSCKVGQNLAAMLSSSLTTGSAPGQMEGASAQCAGRRLSVGAESDFGKAISGFCSTMDNILQTATDFINSAQGADAKAVAKQQMAGQGLWGNETWELLKATRFGGNSPDARRWRIIVMSMLGTTLRTADHPEPQPVSATLTDVKDVAKLFMCGRDGVTSGAPTVRNYCYGYSLGSNEPKVLNCSDDDCLQLSIVPVYSANVIEGPGFLQRVNEILVKAAQSVAADQPLDTEAIQLIQAAPFPLYQAINAAAVYPSAAGDLLNTMSTLTAEVMVYAYFTDYIRNGVGDRYANVKIDLEKIRKIQGFLEEFTHYQANNQRTIASGVALQEALSEQVRKLNIAIQREVMNPDLLGNQKYATTLTTPAP